MGSDRAARQGRARPIRGAAAAVVAVALSALGAMAGASAAPPGASPASGAVHRQGVHRQGARRAGAASARASGAVRAGDSKTSCLYLAYANESFQPALAAAEQATGMAFDCLETFVNGTTTWAQWEAPWIDGPAYGFTTWEAADPARRTLVLSMDLVPDGVAEANGAPDPASWEPACAAGADDAHAANLARNLVAAGFADAVIRLGFEMNGSWEPDFAGTTRREDRQWAACFAHEVHAMRTVPGAHFLFDWNPNACVDNLPLADLYPGNAAVDLIGVDAYDAFCNPAHAPTRAGPAAFRALAAEPDGLGAVTAFARRQAKPMSLPEWGTEAAPTGLGDDAAYVRGIGRWVASHDVAFQSYFDRGDDGILTLSPQNPATLAAYTAAFG